MSVTFKNFNLALRGLMELGIVSALGYWGFATGDSAASKILLGLGAPILGFGIWGLIDFHQTGALAEPLRLIQELIISGAAALAWYSVGASGWGLALALISIVHHILVYATGGKLLKHH